MKQYVLIPRDTLQAHYNTLEAYCGYTDEEVTELRNLLAEPCEPVAWLACDSEGDRGLGFKETADLLQSQAERIKALEEELYGLNQDDGKLQRALERKQAEVDTLTAGRAALANAERVEPDDGCAPNHMCNGHRVHIPTGECCNKCGATSW